MGSVIPWLLVWTVTIYLSLLTNLSECIDIIFLIRTQYVNFKIVFHDVMHAMY